MRLLVSLGLTVGGALALGQAVSTTTPARTTPGTTVAMPATTARDSMAVLASDVVQAVSLTMQALPPAQYNPLVAGAQAQAAAGGAAAAPRWQLNFTFRNVSANARRVPWSIQLGNQSIAAGEQLVAAGAGFTATTQWTQVPGNHDFRGRLDPNNQLGEGASHLANNLSAPAKLLAPGVSGIAPSSGGPGTVVRIFGAGFLQGGAAQVQFAFPIHLRGTRLQAVAPQSISDTEISITVPRAERRWRPRVGIQVQGSAFQANVPFDYTPPLVRHQLRMGAGNYGSLAYTGSSQGNATPSSVDAPDHSSAFFTWWEGDASSITPEVPAINFLNARHGNIPENAVGLAGFVPDPRSAAGVDVWALPGLDGCRISQIQFSGNRAELDNPPANMSVASALRVRWSYPAGGIHFAGYRLAVFFRIPDGLDCGSGVRPVDSRGAFLPDPKYYGGY